MKVLYVSDAGSVHTRRWVEYFRDCGAKVHVASFRPAHIEGVAVHVMPTLGLGKFGYIFSIPFLRRLASRIDPDIVHAQYITSYGFIAAAARLRPLVLTAWGTDVLISPKQSCLMRWLASFALHRADEITTVAEHMNLAVMALGIPADRVNAVPFGVDTQYFVPPVTERLDHAPLRLICTRNFGPIYSVHTLIEALEIASTKSLKLTVDLVGEGSLRAELESQVTSYCLESSVTFRGHVDHEELVRLLAAAHIFVTPAISDGNNVSLNEAMACGCFPIATDIPANSQWIEHGVNGLLYPAGDASSLANMIELAVLDVELRKKAVTLNRRIVEKRADWRVCVVRMKEIYRRAISSVECK